MVRKFLSKLREKLFGRKNPRKNILRLSIGEVPLFLEKDFFLQKSALEDFSAKKLAEAKYLHKKSSLTVEEVAKKELPGKPNERLNRAVATAKKQLVSQLQKLLERIDPEGRGKTVEDARKYAGQSKSLLYSEILSFHKSIVYTGFYFKEEMRVLGESLSELLRVFGEMNEEFGKAANFFDLEKAKERVESVLKNKDEVAQLVAKRTELEKAVLEREKKSVEQKANIEEKKGAEEMVTANELDEELARVESQKQEVKAELAALLSGIDRPLSRFRQLVESGRWKLSAEESETLAIFAENPLNALKKDPRGESFKKVLAQLKKSIEGGEVELKEREREKRLESLEDLMSYDFFGNIFWKTNELQKKQNSLMKEIEKNEAKRSLGAEEGKLTAIGKEINELKEQIIPIEKRLLALSKEISKEEAEVKEFAQKALGVQIIIEDKE